MLVSSDKQSDVFNTPRDIEYFFLISEGEARGNGQNKVHYLGENSEIQSSVKFCQKVTYVICQQMVMSITQIFKIRRINFRLWLDMWWFWFFFWFHQNSRSWRPFERGYPKNDTCFQLPITWALGPKWYYWTHSVLSTIILSMASWWIWKFWNLDSEHQFSKILFPPLYVSRFQICSFHQYDEWNRMFKYT